MKSVNGTKEKIAEVLCEYLHGGHRPDNVTPIDMLNTYNPGLLPKLEALVVEARIAVYREVLDNLHHSEFKKYIMELYNNDLKAFKAPRQEEDKKQ
jgi:hypothetical protein